MPKPATEKVRDYRERQKAEGWKRVEMYAPERLHSLIRAIVKAVIEAVGQKGNDP